MVEWSYKHHSFLSQGKQAPNTTTTSRKQTNIEPHGWRSKMELTLFLLFMVMQIPNVVAFVAFAVVS